VNDKIRKIVGSSDFNLATLRAEARASGMKTMFEDGIEKAQLALTSIEEVLRVIQE